MTTNPLSVTVAGITLASPLLLLSGCAGFAEEFAAIEGFDFSSIGAICLKGTTLEPRLGNAPPRLAETPAGMLNAIGLQNPGAKYVVGQILPRIAHLPTKLIANIAGSSIAEYGEVARVFDNSPVAAIEINISCPNVKEGGAAFGADPQAAGAVVAAVRQATSKPIITKLSPNVTDIRSIAHAAIDAGSDAFSAINTLMGMAIDIHSRKPILGNRQGGLSGPAIKPIALLKVWQLYQLTKPLGIPIIGQGGIACTEDAVEFFLAGANAVGIGTALFRNPLLPQRIHEQLRQYLENHGFSSVAALTGAMNLA
ncbi:dihydroorotate dehydrogenase [Candidatus Magnetaquicoccus inordinatus]|uniref:dihydroorotate dehydrogenase n=1 Tax=Candidatus Magnetaquicoccus inordinatus TaxID=2496818 RepID=UPI00102C9C95|nr:dihydroorotate dehydrogenase [Candidatus Magnetaquicoccus inordinatus]